MWNSSKSEMTFLSGSKLNVCSSLYKCSLKKVFAQFFNLDEDPHYVVGKSRFGLSEEMVPIDMLPNWVYTHLRLCWRQICIHITFFCCRAMRLKVTSQCIADAMSGYTRWETGNKDTFMHCRTLRLTFLHCMTPCLPVSYTRPWPAGPRWIVGREHFSPLTSRLRRSARRGPDPRSVQKCPETGKRQKPKAEAT